jgi:hypothetical protein
MALAIAIGLNAAEILLLDGKFLSVLYVPVSDNEYHALVRTHFRPGCRHLAFS